MVDREKETALVVGKFVLEVICVEWPVVHAWAVWLTICVESAPTVDGVVYCDSPVFRVEAVVWRMILSF